MWVREYSKLYENIDKDKVWQIMIDINNWPTWHGDLEYCELGEGGFKVGNHFYLKPKEGSKMKIILTEIEEYKRFTDCTKFFGAEMYDTHSIQRVPGGLLISHRMAVNGILSWLWIKLVCQNIFNNIIPQEMDALVNLARTK